MVKHGYKAKVAWISKLTVAGVLLFLCIATSLTCQNRTQTNEGFSSIEPTQLDKPADSQLDLSSIDLILQNALADVGGGIALVLLEKDRVVYRKAFGNYKIDRVLPVASATKWLTGAVIMALVDEGVLNLDDPVARHIPGFAGEKSSMTIRHLFAHTSGLPPETACRNNKATSLEECANSIAQTTLRSEPGAQFHYGGVSMHLGGRVAEVVTGKPWNQIFKEKLGMPLGMNQTDYFAYGDTGNPRPAGDARSSLDDFGKFLRMLLNRGMFEGTRILSEQAITELHQDQTGGASISYSIFWDKGHLDPNLPKAKYGVGVWIEKQNEATGETIEASSPGALGAYPWIDFRQNVAGVILAQSSFSRVLPIYLRVKREYAALRG